MKFTVFHSPCTFAIIDDWMSLEDNQQIFTRYLPNQIRYLLPSKVGTNRGSVIASSAKSSKNLWLYQHEMQYPSTPKLSKLFEKYMWGDENCKAIKSVNDNLFQASLFTNHSTLLLSQYVENDRYEWHRDYSPMLTANYMFCTEPKKFQGGEFLIGAWNSTTIEKIIPFKNNRLILFPSRIYHKVNAVHSFSGEALDARFTLQYWCQLKHRQET